MASSAIIERLYAILQERKGADPDSSYTARLYAKGLNKMLEKVGEEAVEVIIAAKDGDRGETIYEMADLWFHCLVVMAEQGIEPEAIFAELESRFGKSGIRDKGPGQN